MRKLLIAAAGMLALAGCSGSPGPATAPTATVIETVTVAPEVPAPEVPAAAPAGPQVKVEAAPRVAPSGQFLTPSGNIECGFLTEYLVCYLWTRQTPPAPRPTDCSHTMAWNTNTVMLNASGAQDGRCAGGAPFNAGSGKVLPYGSAMFDGDFGCLVEEAGLTCVHTGTGRGFFVSKENWQTF